MFLYSNGGFGSEITDDIVGLCVVPSTHTEDGNARFMCLTDTDENGNKLSGIDHRGMIWGPQSTENLNTIQIFSSIPSTTKSDPCTITGSQYNGYMPSDINLTQNPANAQCLPDGLFWGADGGDTRCPYPYLSDWSKNPAYTSGNVDTKFLDGWTLTRKLTGFGDDYKAAKAAVAYSANTPGFETYLPTIGELGYMMARLGRVNEILKSLGTKAQEISLSGTYWASSDYSYDNARRLVVDIFALGFWGFKDVDFYLVRPFIKPKF